MIRKLTRDEFIEKANNSKNVKKQYDYSKVVYINNRAKVEIVCELHNISFMISPDNFLQGKNGCPDCHRDIIKNLKLKKYSTESFIDEAKKSIKVKQNYYDYSRVSYVNNKTDIEIGCPKHGWIFINPRSFLATGGCCKDKYINSKTDTDGFILKAMNSSIVKSSYDYSRVNYINSMTKVEIGCPKHGFFFAIPGKFLLNNGCPKCFRGFQEYVVLTVFEILFKTNFEKIKATWIRNPKTNYSLELDGYAYIDYLNIAIGVEYQGDQHEKIIVKYKMTEEKLLYRKQLDQIKRDKCRENGVYLIEIPQFTDNFKPIHLKKFIKQKCLDQNIPLPDDFDEIIINIEEIALMYVSLNENIGLQGK